MSEQFSMRAFSATAQQLRDRLLPRATAFYTSPTFLWMIIGYGVLLRLSQYLFNRSLWADETLLALNIIHRSFSELFKPLDYVQGAPIGFLILERLAVRAAGNGEYALRLFPLLCGIFSLLLFYQVAKLSLTPKAVPIALGLFATSGRLIYYSSEVKQYSSDVAIALLLFSAVIYFESCELSAWRVAVLGFLGAAAVWFSHPAVFILAGAGMSLTSSCLIGKRWAKIRSFWIAYSLWALGLAACYLVHLRHLSNNKDLLNYWSPGFVPLPLLSVSTVDWFVSTFFGVFENPVGLNSGIAALTFLVGCISMFSYKRERFYLLIAPIFFTLLAAAFRKYPFSERLILFTVPIFLLLVAEGAEQLRYQTSRNSPTIGVFLLGLLFFLPLSSATYHLIKPRTMEEIRPVISYVKQHERNGDVIYLYYGAVEPFQYYAEWYDFRNYMVGIASRENWANYVKDLDKLRGLNRVWVLFSHNYSGKGVDEEKFFLYQLDSRGKRLDSFRSVGAAVYLYDLSEPESPGRQ